ncbi:hypothetical protein DEU56DRAFT_235986 [Suillus clintonianus]|uniref:uncharacterized protein n=1 Tax=Suillus clintonianus TaxID=1904413 RepID=UPI001B87B557|nr:uncharacterized protein DEU56DRAFT_235986 [Suillus clintonianus]KAG2144229.1 hypothetical protein DEU56DRAFT_235986 [Suillus clintonianus]
MSSSAPTLTQVEAVDIVFTLVAIIATSFRLYVRVRQGRLWIDDAWATLGMIFNFTLLVALCLYLQDYKKYPQGTRVALYYIAAQCFYAVVWSSRISILFTIVRLTVPGTFMRRVLMCTAIIFGIVWALLFSQLWWICESEPGWKTQPHPQCNLGRNVAITQMITDVLGDSVLIMAPFCLIYKVRLSRAQKVRVSSVFSASAITTAVSLTHAYYIFSGGGLKVIMTAIVEASVSLIVANLSVVVAFLCRLSTEDDAPASPPAAPIITFGSQPARKRVRDPLATTFTGAEIATIVLEDQYETRPRSLKTSDADEITLNNREVKQTSELC